MTSSTLKEALERHEGDGKPVRSLSSETAVPGAVQERRLMAQDQIDLVLVTLQTSLVEKPELAERSDKAVERILVALQRVVSLIPANGEQAEAVTDFLDSLARYAQVGADHFQILEEKSAVKGPVKQQFEDAPELVVGEDLDKKPL